MSTDRWILNPHHSHNRLYERRGNRLPTAYCSSASNGFFGTYRYNIPERPLGLYSVELSTSVRFSRLFPLCKTRHLALVDGIQRQALLVGVKQGDIILNWQDLQKSKVRFFRPSEQFSEFLQMCRKSFQIIHRDCYHLYQEVSRMQNSIGPSQEELADLVSTLRESTDKILGEIDDKIGHFEQDFREETDVPLDSTTLFEEFLEILQEVPRVLYEKNMKYLDQLRMISPVQFLPLEAHFRHLSGVHQPIFRRFSPFPDSVIDLITEYSLELSFHTKIRTKEISYPDPCTAFKHSMSPDCSSAVANFGITRRTKLSFRIHKKQDEMWIGVSNDIATLYHSNGYWCWRNAWTFYGGRESRISRIDVDEFQALPNLEAKVPADSGYGSIQSGNRNYFSPTSLENPDVRYKLQPYTDGDLVEMIVDPRHNSLLVTVNGEFQVSHEDPEDWGRVVFPFVVLDCLDDCVEMHVELLQPLSHDPD